MTFHLGKVEESCNKFQTDPHADEKGPQAPRPECICLFIVTPLLPLDQQLEMDVLLGQPELSQSNTCTFVQGKDESMGFYLERKSF